MSPSQFRTCAVCGDHEHGTDGHTYSDADADTNVDAHPNVDFYVDTDANVYANPFKHPYCYQDADAHSTWWFRGFRQL